MRKNTEKKITPKMKKFLVKASLESAPTTIAAHAWHLTADGRLAFTRDNGPQPHALFNSWESVEEIFS